MNAEKAKRLNEKTKSFFKGGLPKPSDSVNGSIDQSIGKGLSNTNMYSGVANNLVVPISNKNKGDYPDQFS